MAVNFAGYRAAKAAAQIARWLRRSQMCAPESACGQRGVSPLQVNALRPVTKCNCVAKRRGGEQQEVNDQSVG